MGGKHTNSQEKAEKGIGADFGEKAIKAMLNGKSPKDAFPEPETKQISHAVFKALMYSALTIQEMVEHKTEYTESERQNHLEIAYRKLKEAGVF